MIGTCGFNTTNSILCRVTDANQLTPKQMQKFRTIRKRVTKELGIV